MVRLGVNFASLARRKSTNYKAEQLAVNLAILVPMDGEPTLKGLNRGVISSLSEAISEKVHERV